MLKSSNLKKTYELGQTIGKGSFGQVFNIKDTEDRKNDKMVAKIIDNADLDKAV